ncbi:hypothetical protein C2W62_03105 [Candidatus Entotheonella serta]|nr:hypothetical protein C2W62_03105 [Candidatus Entotheonella serta]
MPCLVGESHLDDKTVLLPEDFTQGLCNLFRSLDGKALAYLLAHMTPMTLQRHDVLFYQGDPPDSLYLVVHGQLGALHQKQPADAVLVNTIGPGETVGENGLMSGSPRGLTIKALSDCELLKLAAADFEQFYQLYPSSLLDLSQLVINRHNQTLDKFVAEKPRPYCIALVRTETTPAINRFLETLGDQLASLPGMKLVSAKDIEAQHIDNPLHAPQLLEFIENSRSDITCFIYCTPLADRRLEHFYEHFFDAVVWLADASSSPQSCGQQWADLSLRSFAYAPRKELLLLYQYDGPRHTQPWLDWDTFTLIHHVRLDQVSDYDRLLRFFSGTAVGLMLSGGGARGWVHIGVLRALIEAQIPIDAIEGTSSGAIAAACYATTLDADACYQSMYDISMSEANPMALRNFTLPLVSILSAKRGTKSLVKQFGDLRLEDLPIPFFCIACNLNQSREVIWQQGEMWKKIRASMAIPGLLPPVVEDGELYVDGGVMNNLPVDVMRRLLAPRGTVIAADVTGSSLDTQRYNFPPILGFVDNLLTVFKLKNHHYNFPNFGETMLKSLCMGAMERVELNRAAADLLIRPDLGDIGLVSIRRGQRLVNTGYQETKRTLANQYPASTRVQFDSLTNA